MRKITPRWAFFFGLITGLIIAWSIQLYHAVEDYPLQYQSKD